MPEIDIPILTQSTDASEGLLLELSPDELTKGSRERLAPILEQEWLSTKTLRENAGVSVERQLGLAETLSEDPERWAPLLSWRGIPDYDELKETCSVLWDHFPEGRRDWGVVSAAQLTYWLNRSASQPGALSVIDAEILSKGLDEEGREAQLLRILTFMRNCLSFGFPRYVMVMDSIQREVFNRHGIKPGDYGPYAVSVENSFLPAPLSALDEYGIPLELAYKLIGSLAPDGDLDAVLERLRQLPEDQVELGAFERSVLRDTQRYL